MAKFDEILENVLESLPDDIQKLLETVPLIVEDEPSDELIDDMGLDPELDDLCGAHWGTPIHRRLATEPDPMSLDRIYIFRGPIKRMAGKSERQLEKQIRITLLHEIGHHFGLDEARLEELGYG